MAWKDMGVGKTSCRGGMWSGVHHMASDFLKEVKNNPLPMDGENKGKHSQQKWVAALEEKKKQPKKLQEYWVADVSQGVSIVRWKSSGWSEGPWLATPVTCLHELPESRGNGEGPHMGWLTWVRGNVCVTLIRGGTCCVIRPRRRPQHSHKSRSGCLKNSGSVKETWSGWPVGLAVTPYKNFDD